MTVFLRDVSDYDTNEDLAGFVGATHKATEGTTVTHQQYGRRLNLWRSQGHPVLGAYHVVRTPGSGGAGSLSSQLDFWLSYMDKQTPWWRDHPHFILQIDLEKWPYDPVSLPRSAGLDAPALHEQVRQVVAPELLTDLVAARASTGMQFAQLLVDAGLPGWKVTYASRGQYGNNLTGIVTPLWNAAYHSSSYPGDGATDWAPYSGKTPVLWQYTSTPFDKNAFRGSLDEFLALTGGIDMAQLDRIETMVRFIVENDNTLQADGKHKPIVTPGGEVCAAGNGVKQELDALSDTVAAVQDKLVAGQPVTLSDADRAAMIAALTPLVPSAADVAAHLDYAALGAAVAAHIKVS